MATVEAEPQPIAVPENFPFAWRDPADAHGLWEREVMHFPAQATVLDEDLQLRAISGFSHGCELYGLPVRGDWRWINTWVYQAIVPISHDRDELERIGRAAVDKLVGASMNQLERWLTVSLPELERMYADFDIDPDALDDEQLLVHLERTLAHLERAWKIHFETVFPMLISLSLFNDLHDELLGDEDGFDAQRLLQGHDNKSLEADRALHALGRRAREVPAALEVLERAAAADVVRELEQLPEAAGFLAELNAYLAEYGRRLRLYITFSEPSFIEDPVPLITVLKDAVTRPDVDPAEELARLATEREARIATARERISAMPVAVREQFEALLSAAQQSVVLQEDHNWAIDCRINYEVRRVIVAVGRRLVGEGAITDPLDVFHLRLEEIRSVLAGTADPALGGTIADRKAALARWAAIKPPPLLGTLPPGAPPDNPIARAVFRMFGGQPAQSQEVGVITGMKGSPGVARGKARVIRSLGDAERLGAGDVLVAETTAPPWTPLFGRAAAIVTDAGGILSHCAIVAREYGLPAVVGTRVATSLIRDGELIEVDGTNGTVRVVKE